MTDGAPGERRPGKEPGVGDSLRTFSLRVLVATVLAAAAVVVLLRWWGAATSKVSVPPAPERTGRAAAAPPRAPAALPDTAPATPVAREIERRHAQGALSDAHKQLERCPGGDLRRLAWIDPRFGVVKLVRERDDGATVQEWFDEQGRLREALVRGRTAAGAWGRRVTIGEDGREADEALAGGVVPDAPPPALDRRDPTAAFFSGPNCAR